MTTKRAIELIKKINNGEKLNKRTNTAFWKFMGSRSIEWVRKHAGSHHYARARGYQPSGVTSIESYTGKFGIGFVVAYPSNESNRPSNQYHDIQYMIVK